jgi:hypothetical protein
MSRSLNFILKVVIYFHDGARPVNMITRKPLRKQVGRGKCRRRNVGKGQNCSHS